MVTMSTLGGWVPPDHLTDSNATKRGEHHQQRLQLGGTLPRFVDHFCGDDGSCWR
jgi:hypothetical protein